VIENLVTVRPSLASVICDKTSLLRVLLTRVKAKRFDEVKVDTHNPFLPSLPPSPPPFLPLQAFLLLA